MKKLILGLGLLLGYAGFSIAQTAPAKKDATTKLAPAKSTASPAKKDGTPDLRYKANKIAAADTTKKLKKNGTPDKRFKENKKKS